MINDTFDKCNIYPLLNACKNHICRKTFLTFSHKTRKALAYTWTFLMFLIMFKSVHPASNVPHRRYLYS